MSSIVSTKKTSLYVFSGIIGNIIEHYDTALFGFLAPFIAHLFFPTVDPLTALIFTYALLPLDLIAKPLGAYVFGMIGDRLGRTRALSLSIMGTAIATGLIGSLPIYADIGTMAPIFLASIRFFQKFFAAGECIGGAIFILEHPSKSSKSFLGSLYSSSSIIGILLASTIVNLFDFLGIIQTHWRWLFWISFGTGIFGVFIRRFTQDAKEFLLDAQSSPTPFFQTIRLYWRPFIAIVTTAGFGYMTYEMAFLFLNSYPPLISNVTQTEMLRLNMPLLILDMLLLPLFGYFGDKFCPTRQMQLACMITILASLPLMIVCHHASYLTILYVRMAWVIIGVLFYAPFHAWSQQLIPPRHRYTLLSIGYTIGSQLIGGPFASIGLWLYQSTALIYAPGIYAMVVAFMTLYTIREKRAWALKESASHEN
ncbi:MAG: MFS transporter [Parachlamydiaceae bacterium]